MTQKMVENATAMAAAKEYPHTDGGRQGRRLFEIITATAEGELNPVISSYDCRMIGIYHTTREPMRGFVDMLNELESRPGVLSISFIMGFPWGDVPDMGTKILVITDNNPEMGAALAEEIGEKLFALRESARPHYLTIDEGLNEALRTEGSPVVLSDSSDNPGGGATGDSTFLLRAMLDRGITNAAIAMIWDPIAVSMAMDAGVGGELDLRIGGKIGPLSGDPVDLHVTVTGLQANAAQYVGPPEARSAIVIGDTAAVHARGIDIVLYSIRHQTFSPDCFTVVGINPLEKHILVVKSSQHFHTTFSPFASRILYIAGPGAHSPFFETLPYRVFRKEIWPWVENPFERSMQQSS
jgi:microcystin degradation protein MlrC